MSGTTPARWEALLGASLSLAAHVFVAFFLWQLPPADHLAAARPDLEWISTAEPTPDGATGSVRGTAAPLLLGMPTSAQNVDAADRGEGGDLDGAVEFTLLVSTAHAVQLQDSVNNSGQVSQAQRIRTARDRASWENRRATPNPESQPFLASGEGIHRQRRPVRANDARAGARRAPRAATSGDTASVSAQGGAAGSGVEMPTDGRAGREVRERREGAEAASPGQGIHQGRGAREQIAADVAHGRPDVDRGPAATLASEATRVRDDRDAERLAAQLVESNVDASRRSGRAAGAGRGGVGGGGAPGAGGGAQEGGRASPHGPGEGAGGLDTSSRRYRTWYLALRRRVEDALVFPRERMLAMDQGQAVFRIQVRRDGSLVDSAQLRSSGFSDMDRAAASAIASATPFERIPSDLAPHSPSIQVDLTVAFDNPMVR